MADTIYILEYWENRDEKLVVAAAHEAAALTAFIAGLGAPADTFEVTAVPCLVPGVPARLGTRWTAVWSAAPPSCIGIWSTPYVAVLGPDGVPASTRPVVAITDGGRWVQVTGDTEAAVRQTCEATVARLGAVTDTQPLVPAEQEAAGESLRG